MPDLSHKVSSPEGIQFKNDDLRAPEANEMLEKTPSWLLRWGVLSVFLIVLLIIGVATMVKYPDTLEGSAIISTDPLPIKLKTSNSGRISQLLQADATTVNYQQAIAEIENPTGYDNILYLQKLIDSIRLHLQNNNEAAIATIVAQAVESLGEAQTFYNQLIQQLSARSLLHKEQLYEKRSRNLQQQIGNLDHMVQISQREKAMIEEELKQADDRFKANEQLYREKVISKQEYYDEAAKLRAKKLQLEQQRRSGIQNTMSSTENTKQILEIQYERADKERTLTVSIEEALRNLSNYIQTWKQHYLLIAPYEGTVQYLRPLQVNEPVNAGEELIAVLPLKKKYRAIVMLPAIGIGKVELGQKVHLLLDNYPYNEFGFMEGTVSQRSTLPESAKSNNTTGSNTQVMYRVYVELSDTLETSYHKKILFNPEMTATGRIITKDRNLLQRLFADVMSVNK